MPIKNNKKYNYFYKITNLLNDNFYYGIHSTDNINDGYMGSGVRLHKAYKKYGIENFKKEILKFFENREDLSKYEENFVTESLVHNNKCYNISCGGDKWKTLSTVLVKDSSGNVFRCCDDDPKYLSGEYISMATGFINVYDKIDCVSKAIPVELYKNNKDRYINPCTGKIIAKLIGDNKFKRIDLQTYKDNKNMYVTPRSNKILAKDKDNNYYVISPDDKRFLDGQLVGTFKNRHHKEETKLKISKAHKESGYGIGTKNNRYGTCWITDGSVNLSIYKNELNQYIDKGFRKGRVFGDEFRKNVSKSSKNRVWIHKENVTKLIKKTELEKYLNSGFSLGRC